jgi:hypothetical protein
MGCRTHHRSSESNRRSAEYYRTPEGKQKKKELNARRASQEGLARGEAKADVKIDSGKLSGYLKFILEQVDRRHVTAEEVGELVTEIYALLRQHSLDNWWRAWQIGDG